MQWQNLFKESRIEQLASQLELFQIIKKPTHILENSTLCIGLTFTSQRNMIITSGAHLSLHPNCHHQLVFAPVDSKAFYPPPYERVFWHYTQVSTNQIKRAIGGFNREALFNNSDVKDQILICDETWVPTLALSSPALDESLDQNYHSRRR